MGAAQNTNTPAALKSKTAVTEIISEKLLGNWLKTDGSNDWAIGFYPKFAIYKNDYWSYRSVAIQGKVTKVILKNKKQSIILTLIPAADGKMVVTEGKLPVQMFSQAKTYRADYKAKGDAPFTILPLGWKKTTIRGFLDGYTPDADFKTGSISLENYLIGETSNEIVTIQPNGMFEITFNLSYPKRYKLELKNKNIDLYSEPGDKQMIYVDLQDRNPIVYMGNHARENADLVALQDISSDDFSRNMSEYGLSPETFKQNRLNEMLTDLDSILVLKNSGIYSPKALQIIEIETEASSHGSILYYLRNHQLNDKKDSPEKMTIPDVSYYNFLNHSFQMAPILPVTKYSFGMYIYSLENSEILTFRKFDDLNILHKDLSSMINFVEINPGLIMSVYNYPTIISAMKEMNIPVTSEENTLLQLSTDSLKVDSVRQKRYYEVLNVFNEKNKNTIDLLANMKGFDKSKAIIQQKMNLSPGFMIEVIALRFLSKKNGNIIYTQQHLDSLFTYFQTPFLREELLRVNTAKKNLQDFKTLQSKTPLSKADQVLQSIIGKYKGNILLVDFWGTGCGPCRVAMKDNKNLPEKFIDKKIKIVYITSDNQSPIKPYNDFIKDIKGEHYRITQDEWNILSSQYKINGLPSYMLVNKNGAVFDDKFEARTIDIKNYLLQLEAE